MTVLRTFRGSTWKLLAFAAGAFTLLTSALTAGLGDPPLLSNLVIRSGSVLTGFANTSLSPSFDSYRLSYSITIPFDHTEIEVDTLATVPVDPTHEVSYTPGLGANFRLEIPANTVTHFVISTSSGGLGGPDGGDRTDYTVAILRGAATGSAALDNLLVSNSTLSPNFGPATLQYNAWVPNEITSVTVTPSSFDPGARITVQGVAIASGAESDPITLAVGKTQIAILVTSADQSVTRPYTVDVTRVDPDPDSDNDGMPDAWENEHGLTVGVDDTVLDLDKDGLCNVCEYAFGSAPNDPGDHAFPTATRNTSGYLVISFHRAIDPSEGLRYRVEVSSDLKVWQRDVLDLTAPDAPETQVWRDYNGGASTSPPNRFIRVRVIAAAP